MSNSIAEKKTTSRVVSNGSVTTNISIGTTISSSNTNASSSSKQLNSDETYEAVLKVILLNYKNEPRFKKKVVLSPASNNILPAPTHLSHLSSHSNDRSKRHSWFHSSNGSESIPKGAIEKLKKVMLDIAMGKNKQITNAITKRCFLHLYNDLLKPGSEIKSVEELAVMFIAAANKEIILYTEGHSNDTDVFKETDIFISVFIDILKTCKNPEDAIKRLQDYRKNIKSKAVNNYENSQNSSIVTKTNQILPSYRLTEIPMARVLGELFSVSELKLQQDVIKLKDISNEETLVQDLAILKSRLEKNEAMLNPDDFDNPHAYFSWKREEVSNLETLITNLKRNTNPTQISGVDLRFIPKDTRDALSDFLTRALQYDLARNEPSIISNEIKTLIEVSCKYWRLNPVTHATALYQAAHNTILKNPDNEIDPEKTEILFGVLFRLLRDAPDQQNWSKLDKKTWITSLSNSYIQVMSSLRTLLSAIFAEKAPKFTPILQVLYGFIEADPLFDIIERSGLPKRWIKRLKYAVLSTTEAKYIETLQSIPRDSSLSLIHIQDTSDEIYSEIKALQKKFPKPLLNEIFIANDAAFLFIKLYSEDVSNMLAHIEHYELKLKDKFVEPADALETYKSLKALRDIFEQVAPPNINFKLNLETFFFKYLETFCDFSSKKLISSVKRSFEADKFEPLDIGNGRGYSSSVLDIFKLINELFALFKKFEWTDEKQMALIYTKLLRAVSESIVYYVAQARQIVTSDLKDEDPLDSNEAKEDNRKSVWLFSEMKAAVSGNSKIEAPAPYSFKKRTCVILNNLSQILKQLNELEAHLDPEEIKLMASSLTPNIKKPVKNVFSIKIQRAENIKPCESDGLTSSYVVLVDSSQRKEVGKTKTVSKTLNPVFDEEFEIETSDNSTTSLTATLWNHGSKLSSHLLLGRSILQLDPKKFRKDGIPVEITRDLDIQGSLVFQISLESEQEDAIFSMGKAYRSVTNAMSKTYKLIVDKFSVFITHSISRHTLKLLCNNNGLRSPKEDETKDAIVPLFDYLNSNLQILANILDADILIEVMLQAWTVILDSADNLLLPALVSVKAFSILSNNSKWKDSFSIAVANVTNTVTVPGFGRTLSSVEIYCVFIWLSCLCDFFYNDGAGPRMETLKNDHYQRLLLIPRHYDEDIPVLKQEVYRLTPLVLKAIKSKNFLGDESDDNDAKANQRSNTLARKSTIAAFGSSKRRAEVKEAVENSNTVTGEFQISTEDIILRILLARGVRDFVETRLLERERLAKSLATERLARMAVHGTQYN